MIKEDPRIISDEKADKSRPDTMKMIYLDGVASAIQSNPTLLKDIVPPKYLS